MALARNLHFGRTSEAQHISPSALSRMIQRLEDELGHTLLVRDSRSVALTEQGRVFRDFAVETIARWEALQQQLASEDELAGKLTLFASVTASQSILPNVLDRFRRDYPGIHIQLETGDAVNALARLHEGCDVVVAALSEDEDEQHTKRIITSIPILTIAPRDKAPVTDLLDRDSVDWSEVPLILPSFGQARDNIDEWLRKNGIRPNIYSEVTGNEAILSLVALGCGVGYVPRLVMEMSPLADKVRVIESGPELQDFHVGFCTRKRSLRASPIIRAFWDSI
ncbi:MAG: HTH-type transcriptional activator IlvY [Pseudomonadales bacterium]|nr:HTH-type transcriptional activator IlvY [Pseudomonadales bacterium]